MRKRIFSQLRKIIGSLDTERIFLKMLRRPQRVLDIGCGTGKNSRVMKKMHPTAEVNGVDVLEERSVLDFVIYRKANVEVDSLPFPGEFFDAVILRHVLEHLRDHRQIGREINRVMKLKGKLYVETPNWTTLFAPSFGFNRHQSSPLNFFDDPTHLKPWSKHGLYEFIGQACSLRVEKVGTVRNWVRLPFDIPLIFIGLFSGRRKHVISSFWNLYGWCVYGIGAK